MNDSLKFFGQPELQNPSMVVGWNVDASKLGARVTGYLKRHLGGQSFAEIEPVEFFSLGGVTIEGNLVQFPESKFYACPGKDLIIFESEPPNYELYKFLNLIMDAAEHFQVKGLYVVGAMVTLGAHTAPRELMGVFNNPHLRDALISYNLAMGLDYETPPGQHPTLNAFLLWVARRRNLPGVTLWVPIPFYLVAADDPRADKRALDFLNQRLRLGMDFNDLDEEIKRQNEIIAEVRNNFPDIDESIRRLESNLRLSAEENQKLVQEMEKFLRGKRG